MIDTHCHIDDEAFASDREFVIARQREAGVQSIVIPGVGVESVQSVMTVCHAHPHYCYPALGLHPEEVKVEWQDERYSTVEAEEVLIEANMSREDRKKIIDRQAAIVILQRYLDRMPREEKSDE